MKRLFYIAICLCLCTGCASPKPKKTPPKETHRPVGTIVSVNEEQKFVLIDAGTYFLANKGEALKSFSNGKETGILTVSDQRKPPFVIADIVGGSPQKGDQVFE